jgi:hypothetical protein
MKGHAGSVQESSKKALYPSVAASEPWTVARCCNAQARDS